MPQVNTLDELPLEDYHKCSAGFKAFRASRRTSADEHELYAVLTNAGLSAESADEYINLEVNEIRSDDENEYTG